MAKKYLTTVFLFCVVLSLHAQNTNKNLHTLIVMFDGLRPDYITPEYMPHVYAFRKNASYSLANHSVYPTVTRVNASSLVTGSYPQTHGLMGNTVYFPEVDNVKGIDTGDASELTRIAEATGDKLLTTKSLGELLAEAGASLMVFSSGSSGQAYLQNHKVRAGIVVNPMLVLPSSFEKDIVSSIGTPPENSKPNTAQHRWATNALLHYGLATDGPMVSVIWFSDPDGTAHSYGMGSPEAIQALRSVDSEFGRIIGAMESKGIMDSYDIVVSTDHGFVTYVGTEQLSEFLIERGLKEATDSDDVVLAGGAIYLKNPDRDNIQAIVSALQAQEWVGAIFTKPGKEDLDKGWIDGTLSFETIHWSHPDRAADILVDYNWDNRTNAYGYEGASFSKGVAGHGGSSPYEIHIPLIVAGPSFKRNYENPMPTSNVDIVPTILKIHGLEIPEKMNGRVMYELLEGVKTGSKNVTRKEIIEAVVQHNWGTYHVQLERSWFDGRFYVDYTKVKRRITALK